MGDPSSVIQRQPGRAALHLPIELHRPAAPRKSYNSGPLSLLLAVGHYQKKGHDRLPSRTGNEPTRCCLLRPRDVVLSRARPASTPTLHTSAVVALTKKCHTKPQLALPAAGSAPILLRQR